MKFDFEIKEIDKVNAIEFVQKYHYSPVMPTINKYFLGFFLNDELKGVLTLGWGTQPRHTFNKMFPSLKEEIFEEKEEEEPATLISFFPEEDEKLEPEKEEKKKPKDYKNPLINYYLEIGKMCLSPDLNKTNAGSQMVSATIRWMKENTNCKFLYTMADGIMGKCGYVYQASNFYFGEKYWTDVYMMENGEKFHPRSSYDMCQENLDWEIARAKSENRVYDKQSISWFTTDFMREKGIKRIKGYMFRYIYPLNKKAKKLMKNGSALKWTREYPKDKDLEWLDVTDKKDRKLIDRPPFTFETAKYNLKNIEAHVRGGLTNQNSVV